MDAPPTPPPEARVLRMARIGHQMSVREAAQRAGVSVSLWRQVEAGYMTPTKGMHTPKIAPAPTLARMAIAVDLSVEDLVSEGQRPDAAQVLAEILRRAAAPPLSAVPPLPSSASLPDDLEPDILTAPPYFIDKETEEAALPYVLEILMQWGKWRGKHAAARPGDIPEAPGAELFENPADAAVWDRAVSKGRTLREKVWLLGAFQLAAPATHERDTSTGLCRA
jgi:hypothetical protein